MVDVGGDHISRNEELRPVKTYPDIIDLVGGGAFLLWFSGFCIVSYNANKIKPLYKASKNTLILYSQVNNAIKHNIYLPEENAITRMSTNIDILKTYYLKNKQDPINLTLEKIINTPLTELEEGLKKKIEFYDQCKDKSSYSCWRGKQKIEYEHVKKYLDKNLAYFKELYDLSREKIKKAKNKPILNYGLPVIISGFFIGKVIKKIIKCIKKEYD